MTIHNFNCELRIKIFAKTVLLNEIQISTVYIIESNHLDEGICLALCKFAYFFYKLYFFVSLIL